MCKMYSLKWGIVSFMKMNKVYDMKIIKFNNEILWFCNKYGKYDMCCVIIISIWI